MNKSELIGKIATQADISNAAATRALDAAMRAITETLVKGEPVALVGFGSFSTAQSAERKGRNPSTGAEITIPAKTKVSFKPGKALKDAVNS